MRAMILAAGMGTRLRPLTDDRPKALVEVAGHTLLEITLRRLARFGIREVIINVHHFADMVVDYLRKNDNFDMRIEISREEVLLDTGGGLKKAAWFFLEEAKSDEPFLLHNVDVLSMIDIPLMVEVHRLNQALATLAVQDRETSRFSGVHVISPRLFSRMAEDGVFSIIHSYLRLAGEGEKILAFRADEYYWRDLGRPENVVQAAEDVRNRIWHL